MSCCKITLIGFYNYLNAEGQDLFAHITLPTGIDKEVLCDNILLRGGEFEVLYSDPYFMQRAIKTWSSKWQRTFTKWVEALAVEYNPLENYDRTETWTDKNTGTVTDAGGSTNTGTIKNTGTVDNDVTSTNTGTQTNTNSVSAYDSDTLRANTKDTRTDNLSNIVDGKTTNNLTQTNNLSASSNNTRTDNLESSHNGRIHGNIGVTTSQQMLQSELDISTWNIYEHITDIFLNEFVIAIY